MNDRNVITFEVWLSGLAIELDLYILQKANKQRCVTLVFEGLSQVHFVLKAFPNNNKNGYECTLHKDVHALNFSFTEHTILLYFETDDGGPYDPQ